MVESWSWCATWGAAASGQPLGRLNLGHRHVSLRRLSEVCPSWLQSSWFALGIWYIISFTLRIWQSRSLCVGVAFGVQHWIFLEILRLLVGAFLGSTVDTCSASVTGRSEELHTFSTFAADSIPDCVSSPFGLNGEECPVDASGCSFAPRSSHLDHWTIFSSFT